MKTKSFLIIILCLLFSFACGKKSSPTPIFSGDRIAWRNVNVNLLENNCLVVNAEIRGKSDDVGDITLEIEAINDNICVTCPFLPSENITVKAQKTKLSPDILQVNFSYCPIEKEDSYRYRLGAKNTNQVYPIVVTMPKIVEKKKDVLDDFAEQN